MVDQSAARLAGTEDHIGTAVQAAVAVAPLRKDRFADHEEIDAVAVVASQRYLTMLIDLGLGQDSVVACVAEVLEEFEDSAALLRGVSEAQVHPMT